MSLVADLAAKPGVIAAGEYSYRGDRFSFKGELDSESARMASIMCRATTMSTIMASRTAAIVAPEDDSFVPLRGWIVRGGRLTICGVANVFCMLDNQLASVNAVMGDMQSQLGAAPDEMV